MTTPSLFGISLSNRNFSDAYYWGKNQFNSAFPVSLACYIHSKNLPLVYVQYLDETKTKVGEISLPKVFGSDLPNDQLYFSFESRFEQFKQFVHDELPAIDLVVCAGNRENQLKPLEIKLTTLPDNTTETLDESLYGTELVIRSATTRYMALSMAQAIADAGKKSEVKAIFESVFATVRNWDSKAEMLQISRQAVAALMTFLNQYKSYQTPILLQPIWKTVGKSPQLAENCLDIFVWSDFALTHLFLDSAKSALGGQNITRPLRAALRLSRFIYESSKSDKVYQAPIYDGMTFENQNDKEFAISGTKSRPLMSCDRLIKPAITKAEVKSIVLGGGQKFLSPERRFDAILYFSTDLFEDL